MENKRYWIIALVILLITFAAGRFSTPEKVRVEIKTVEVEKKHTETKKEEDEKRHTETVVVEVEKPDGTKEKTTKTVSDTETLTKTDKSKVSERTGETSTSKETIKGTSKTTIAAMAGIDYLTPAQVIFGVQVYRPVLGPIGIGLYTTTDYTVGATVGVSF